MCVRLYLLTFHFSHVDYYLFGYTFYWISKIKIIWWNIIQISCFQISFIQFLINLCSANKLWLFPKYSLLIKLTKIFITKSTIDKESPTPVVKIGNVRPNNAKALAFFLCRKNPSDIVLWMTSIHFCSDR